MVLKKIPVRYKTMPYKPRHMCVLELIVIKKMVVTEICPDSDNYDTDQHRNNPSFPVVSRVHYGKSTVMLVERPERMFASRDTSFSPSEINRML